MFSPPSWERKISSPLILKIPLKEWTVDALVNLELPTLEHRRRKILLDWCHTPPYQKMNIEKIIAMTFLSQYNYQDITHATFCWITKNTKVKAQFRLTCLKCINRHKLMNLLLFNLWTPWYGGQKYWIIILINQLLNKSINKFHENIHLLTIFNNVPFPKLPLQM